MSSMPIPVSSAPVTKTPAQSGISSGRVDASGTVTTQRRNVTNEIESTDSASFLSYIMAGMMSNQNFSLTSTEPNSFVASSAASFGGTFNMDPSMLILPEGIDATTLVASADGQVNFSAELLAALTPGVPVEIDALGVVDGQVVARMEGDPRLIATGLDPAQMQALVARLSSMASQQANSQATPAINSSVAIVSFLPDQPVVSIPENAVVVSSNVASNVISDSTIKAAIDTPATTKAVSDVAAALIKPAENGKAAVKVDAAVATDVAVENAETHDFDPLEFRLAAKPSRYGSVSPYQQTAVSASTSAAVAVNGDAASANVNAAIKGVMQNSAQAEGSVSLASALPADPALDLGTTLTTAFDPTLATSVTSATAQTSALTNPVLQNVSAIQSHPATQAVAALINKTAQQGNGTQILAIQLDPPELGKMQLKMRYEKGEPLRVHVVLEKADTMNMFQRDSHALQTALNDAGIQTDSSSLTFDLGGQSSFGDALNDQTGGNPNAPGWIPDAVAEAPLETQMSIAIDPKTGLAHYSLLV